MIVKRGQMSERELKAIIKKELKDLKVSIGNMKEIIDDLKSYIDDLDKDPSLLGSYATAVCLLSILALELETAAIKDQFSKLADYIFVVGSD